MNETTKDVNKSKKKLTAKWTSKFKVKDFIKGRMNKEAHIEFLDIFLEPTFSDKLFKNQVKYGRSFTDIVSISDEAFVKLLLINSWDRWEDINQHHNNQFRIEKRNAPDKYVSNIQPKYTSSFLQTNKCNKNLKKGWSCEGINNYNILCKDIMKDRLEHNAIDDGWIKKKKDILESKGKRKYDAFVPTAFNELDDIFQNDSDIDADNDDDFDGGLKSDHQSVKTLLSLGRLKSESFDKDPLNITPI